MNRTAPATVTAESGRTDAVWPVPVGPSEPEPGSEGGMIDPSTDSGTAAEHDHRNSLE